MSLSNSRAAGLVLATALSASGIAALALTAPASAQPVTHVARCGNGDLAVTRTFVDGAAGHGALDLVYRNRTHRMCTVFGYPGLDVLSDHGRTLAHAVRVPSGRGPRTVTIHPGGFASAQVEWLDMVARTGKRCTTGTKIETIVANTTRPSVLAAPVSVCGLTVHQGTAGVPQYPGYAPAQYAWLEGAHTAEARMGLYWARAEDQLKAGGVFPTQVGQLKELRSYPITGLTPTQIARVQKLTRELDVFFATPGLYID